MPERKKNGQFAPGNPGGPGRPRRSVEQDYLAALSDVVSVDAWKRIVERAIQDAENGDARARAWLSGYLLRTEGSLMDIAAAELSGKAIDDRVQQASEAQQRRDSTSELLASVFK